jgi:hypothetical protein
MPMFGPGGISIMLCPGWDGGDSANQHAMAMGGHGQSNSHDHDKSNHANSDHPCAFSVVAGSDPGPALEAVAAPIATVESTHSQAQAVRLGRSLSALPPPSTGPPLPA